MNPLLVLSGILCLLLSKTVAAQERFYFRNNSTFPYRLVEADDKEIKFIELKGGNPVRRGIERDGIVVAFNAFGLFIVVKDIPTNPEDSRRALEKFYKTTGPATDVLIKAAPVEVIPATIRMQAEAVNYLTKDSIPASINKSDLVAVIYRDGRHELFKDVEEAESLLSAAVDQVLKLPRSGQKRLQDSAGPSVAKQPAPKEPEKPVLSEIQYKESRKTSLIKVQQLSNYLQVIADQNFSASERDLAIKNALALFLPGTQIEVSSKNRKGVTKLPLENYLKRLKMLPYGSVQIKWSQIEFVTELKQEADGNYYGTIVGNQTFTGYSENGQNILYSDLTKKSVRVKVESYQKEVEGQSQTNWTVLLGNIGVVSED